MTMAVTFYRHDLLSGLVMLLTSLCLTTHNALPLNATASSQGEVYGRQCSVPDNDQCQTSQGQQCVTLSDGDHRCLCDVKHFRHYNVCRSVTDLKATALQETSPAGHEEITIKVIWSPTPFGAEYKATLSTGQASDFGNDTSFSFTGLTQGTAYSFTVTSRKLRNPGYSSQDPYATVVSNSASVYTKPAQPGELLDKTLPGPRVTLTFSPSEGHVDSYKVTVTSERSKTPLTPRAPVKVEANLVSVMFPGLRPMQYYTVSIIATSNGISSEERTATFRVQGQPAGAVSSLTLKAHESRWAVLTWTRPVNPNGVITGYTVKMRVADMSCVSGLTISCSDCAYDSVEVTPDTSRCTHSATQKLTLAEMDDERFVVEVNVTQLMPNVEYQVDVVAYNEEGSGYPDRQLSFTTDFEAAANLEAMEVTAPAIGQLKVSWTPGEKRGPTSYIVTWEEQVSLMSSDYTVTNEKRLEGYSTNSYIITGLDSYWNYRVTVSTSTDGGPAPENRTVVYRTLESKPGKVQNLQLKQSDEEATKVTLTFDCPPERERNGNLVAFRYETKVTKTQSSDPPVLPEGSVKTSGGNMCDSKVNQTMQVTAETSYVITVYAVTEGGLTGEGTEAAISVEARAPKVLQKPASELMAPQTKAQTSVTVTINTEVLSAQDGQLDIAGLLVCHEKDRQVCNGGSMASNTTADLYKDRIQTWSEFNRTGGQGVYRPTPDDWHRSFTSTGPARRSSVNRRGAGDSFQYTIGSDTTCADLPDDVYCNGPLSAGQQYYVYVFSCTQGGCSETTEPMAVKTLDEGQDPGPSASNASSTSAPPASKNCDENLSSPSSERPFRVVWKFPYSCQKNGFSPNQFDNNGLEVRTHFQTLAEELEWLLFADEDWLLRRAELVTFDTVLSLMKEFGVLGAYKILLFHLNLPTVQDRHLHDQSSRQKETPVARVTRLVSELVDAVWSSQSQLPLDTYPVLPYIGLHRGPYLYIEEDYLENTLTALARMGVPGVVLWGSTTSYLDPTRCAKLEEHVRYVLGPFVMTMTQFMADCSAALCAGHGRCVHNFYDPLLDEVQATQQSIQCSVWHSQFADYHCRCYSGWDGACCQIRKPLAC